MHSQQFEGRGCVGGVSILFSWNWYQFLRLETWIPPSVRVESTLCTVPASSGKKQRE